MPVRHTQAAVTSLLSFGCELGHPGVQRLDRHEGGGNGFFERNECGGELSRHQCGQRANVLSAVWEDDLPFIGEVSDGLHLMFVRQCDAGIDGE